MYRYGGEELLVVLPGQDLEGAAIAAERMRREVESLQVAHPGIGPPPGVVTVSGGVACYSPDDGGDPGKVLKRADESSTRRRTGGATGSRWRARSGAI